MNIRNIRTRITILVFSWLNVTILLSGGVYILMLKAQRKYNKFIKLNLPGEFTLRAFLNGRLDLSQAENVGKLISAKSIAAADSALAGIQASKYFG